MGFSLLKMINHWGVKWGTTIFGNIHIVFGGSSHLVRGEDHPKINKPYKGHLEGNIALVRGLTIIKVNNHLLTGMILRVYAYIICMSSLVAN